MHQSVKGLRRGMVMAMACLAAGCSLIPDYTEDYQQAERLEPLQVANWYDRDRLREQYPVPRARGAFVASDDFKVPAPPEPGSDLLQSQFDLRQAEGDIWLASPEPTGKVWPALQAWLQSLSAELLRQDPATGLLTAELSQDSLRSRNFASEIGLQSVSGQRLSARLSQGLKLNSSELRLEAEPGGSMRISEALLQQFASYVEQNPGVMEQFSLAAQDLDRASRFQLQQTPEGSFIQLDLTFVRSWEAVGRALIESGIPLVDVDRSRGEYLVRFNPEEIVEEERSSWWNFWGGDSDETLSDAYNYRLRLLPSGEQIRVQALMRDAAEPTDDETSLQLLNTILTYLS